ncbi:MAG TPA: class I SAM-dependent methyltransferase [Gaiellaceae bacterium]|nr:class I SAM-dependent methyltransferase [Gaiellaceae bacterium]
MADYFTVAEREHDLQNPISREKLLLLGESLRLGAGSRVLDVASGRGGPAVLLAQAFGCTIRGVELRPEFHATSVDRAEAAAVSDRVTFELADASEAELGGDYDVALCLGASFVWGGLAGTLDALEPVVRPGGHVVVGEPFWRRLPLPDDYEDRMEPFTTLEGTVAILESGDLRAVTVIASSEDDFDRYETLHWRAVEEWLAQHPEDPEAAEIRRMHVRFKRTYLRYGRDHLGWAIFVGWKPP